VFRCQRLSLLVLRINNRILYLIQTCLPAAMKKKRKVFPAFYLPYIAGMFSIHL
jgi:hypothetical protein